MNPEDFVAVFRGFWPQARNVAAPRMQDLWGETTEGVPDDVVAYALKRYARAKPHPPTVLEFERFLWPIMDQWANKHPDRPEASEWHRRQRMFAKQDDDRPPIVSKPCGGCGVAIRHEDMGGKLRRFPTDGGLVFQQRDDGGWFAARCPECRGPEIYRRPHGAERLADAPNALPVPHPDAWQSGAWLPAARTPGGPLRDAATASGRWSEVGWPSPEWRAYFAWLNTAVRNTRAWVVAQDAAPEPPLREPGDDAAEPLPGLEYSGGDDPPF
ncbi:MAG: hypothetical protein ACE5Q3_11960 [Alphaproteobacteria bacterium]